MSKKNCPCLFTSDVSRTRVRACADHSGPQISLGGNIRKRSDIEEGNMNKIQGRAWPNRNK